MAIVDFLDKRAVDLYLNALINTPIINGASPDYKNYLTRTLFNKYDSTLQKNLDFLENRDKINLDQFYNKEFRDLYLHDPNRDIKDIYTTPISIKNMDVIGMYDFMTSMFTQDTSKYLPLFQPFNKTELEIFQPIVVDTYNNLSVQDRNFIGKSLNLNNLFFRSDASYTYYSSDNKTMYTINNVSEKSFGDNVQYFSEKNIYLAADTDSSGLWYSTNGKDWTLTNLPSGSYQSFAKYFPEKEIFIVGDTYNAGLWYSLDGITWIQSNITSGYYCDYTQYFSDVEIFITSSGSGIYYSLDGKTWTQSNITTGRFYNYVKYYNDKYIFLTGCLNSNMGILYSLDGKTWEQTNITTGNYQNFIQYFEDKDIFITGNSTNTGILYSEDGITWTQSNITSGRYQNNILFFDNINIFTASYDSGIWYSEDGKTWYQTNITNAGFGKYIYYYPAKNIYLASSNSVFGLYTGVWWSTNCTSWTQTDLSGTGYYDHIIYSIEKEIFIAGSANNYGLYYSLDGKTWTQSNITTGSYMKYMQYFADKDIFITGCDNDTGILYSLDGKTWTQSNITTGDYAGRTQYFSEKEIFITGCYSGLYYSLDGKTWVAVNIKTLRSDAELKALKFDVIINKLNNLYTEYSSDLIDKFTNLFTNNSIDKITNMFKYDIHPDSTISNNLRNIHVNIINLLGLFVYTISISDIISTRLISEDSCPIYKVSKYIITNYLSKQIVPEHNTIYDYITTNFINKEMLETAFTRLSISTVGKYLYLKDPIRDTSSTYLNSLLELKSYSVFIENWCNLRNNLLLDHLDDDMIKFFTLINIIVVFFNSFKMGSVFSSDKKSNDKMVNDMMSIEYPGYNRLITSDILYNSISYETVES